MDLFEYVNKCIIVTCKSNGQQLSGWVYTIDPLTLSIVLVDFNSNGQVNVINGEEIDEIKRIPSEMTPLIEDKLKKLFESEVEAQTDECSFKRKQKLIEILDRNRVPYVKDDNECLNIMDSVLIRAPYKIENCECSNEIILRNVHNLVLQIK